MKFSSSWNGLKYAKFVSHQFGKVVRRLVLVLLASQPLGLAAEGAAGVGDGLVADADRKVVLGALATTQVVAVQHFDDLERNRDALLLYIDGDLDTRKKCLTSLGFMAPAQSSHSCCM